MQREMSQSRLNGQRETSNPLQLSISYPNEIHGKPGWRRPLSFHLLAITTLQWCECISALARKTRVDDQGHTKACSALASHHHLPLSRGYISKGTTILKTDQSHHTPQTYRQFKRAERPEFPEPLPLLFSVRLRIPLHCQAGHLSRRRVSMRDQAVQCRSKARKRPLVLLVARRPKRVLLLGANHFTLCRLNLKAGAKRHIPLNLKSSQSFVRPSSSQILSTQQAIRECVSSTTCHLSNSLDTPIFFITYLPIRLWIRT